MTDMDNSIIENVQARQMNTDLTDQVVAMANDMIKGTSKLTLTEAKLLRLLIMQVKPTDEDFSPFNVTVSEFSQLLNIDKSNIYREMDRISGHLLSEVIYIGDGNPKHKWKKFQWLSYCAYENGVLTIELNKHLKPYILGLKKWYTQYRLEEIIGFGSVHSIRIYELIAMALRNQKPYGDAVTKVYIDADSIRKATNTAEKYERISQFKKKVLDIAIKEINEKSSYHVHYEEHKEARRIVGFYFVVQSRSRYLYVEQTAEQRNDPRQMTIDDYT